jgi:tRNA (cmo5U34)-methyltransferase
MVSMEVGDGIVVRDSRWNFGRGVVKSFDDHVRRSIPFYDEGHELIIKLSDFFIRPGGSVCEVGCSTATLTRALAQRHRDPDTRFIAIDIEPFMTSEARLRCAGDARIQVVEADAGELDFAELDFVALYYTLQFIRRNRRSVILARLYASLPPGGALVLFEKVRSPTSALQDVMQQLYTDYKIDHGYSPDEVIGKSRSLRGVLDPLTSEENADLLRQAGFSHVASIQKFVCFEGFLAIK